jgi:hypothetical protein
MRVENQVSQSPEDGTAKSSTSWAARAGRQLLSQRADFSTIGAAGMSLFTPAGVPFLQTADTFLVHDSPACAALVLSGLFTGGYTVLRAPLPKDVDLSDASARAAHAAAKRRALLVRSLVHSYATACLSPDV